MKNKTLETIDSLSNIENEQIKKLHNLVQEAINEEALIIDDLEHPSIEKTTAGQKLSDKVAKFGGSWNFIILFSIIIILWITFNVIAIKQKRFDPYPFILMNLVLSCIAAFQAPIIMMSQNRQEEKDRKRAENDYLINLKAEIEIRNLNKKINLLMEEQLKELMEIQKVQLKLLHQLNDNRKV